MWRTVTGESSGGSGTSVSSPPEPELTSAGFLTHDSSLLGLLSTVSRPAVSFLQRYLPGRAVKRDFLEADGELLRRFDILPPPPQLYSLPWFNLSELGIQSPENMSPQTGFLGSGSAVESSVLMPGPGSGSKSWWGGLWSGAEEEQVRCSGVTLCAENRTVAFIQERSERARTSTDKGTFSPGLPSLPRLSLIQNLGVRGDIFVLTPDQDHGYSSLEEEQLVAKARLQTVLPGMGSAEEPRDEPEEPEETEEELPVLKCENKTIAFIMGCPCSDDSGSEDSEEEEEEGEEEEEEEDDDGFDSVCSSEVSGSEEEDDEEFDSETERLWNSLCQSNDPYNPRNFTAKLGSAPRPIPRTGLGSEEDQSSPGSCASSLASSASSSSFASSSSWDEASDAEEQNLKLLGSFCSSDPYSPLNFQAPIRTKARPGTKPGPDPKLEEQRVRKISECSQSSNKATSKKKVRFCSEVQVYSVGSEERRGQWEEIARDRARFLKRCRDVEEVLSPCLQPEHRRRVYQRISQSEARAESEEGHTSYPESVSEREERGTGHSQKLN